MLCFALLCSALSPCVISPVKGALAPDNRGEEDWAVELVDSLDEKVATLSVATKSGDTIRVYNVYNQRLALNPKLIALSTRCMGDFDLLFGDFNLHDPAWEGDSGRPDTAGKTLFHLTLLYNMKCLNTPGKKTWSRSSDPTKSSSVIDLAFAGKCIDQRP